MRCGLSKPRGVGRRRGRRGDGVGLRSTVGPGRERVCLRPLGWGVIALTVLLEPTITVRVKVALAAVPPTASWRPPGVVWKVSCTVFGSSRSDRGGGEPAGVRGGQFQLQI